MNKISKPSNFDFETYSKLGEEVLFYGSREPPHQPELLALVVIFKNWFVVEFAEALNRWIQCVRSQNPDRLGAVDLFEVTTVLILP
jgi:hypothetical protein